MMWWWVVVLVVIISYIAYKVLVFFAADGDFTVISKRLKPEYFKGKVIWITGASSGSKYKSFMYTFNYSSVEDIPSR